uniref:Uncharacterized protein n=1 Tax=Fagus sylvatica TaxID=28930 RepID=A0A2N9GP73_FAGSY
MIKPPWLAQALSLKPNLKPEAQKWLSASWSLIREVTIGVSGRRRCRGFDGLLGLRGFCRVFLGGAQPQFLSLMKLLVVGVKMVGLWLYKTKGERARWGL